MTVEKFSLPHVFSDPEKRYFLTTANTDKKEKDGLDKLPKLTKLLL